MTDLDRVITAVEKAKRRLDDLTLYNESDYAARKALDILLQELRAIADARKADA